MLLKKRIVLHNLRTFSEISCKTVIDEYKTFPSSIVESLCKEKWKRLGIYSLNKYSQEGRNFTMCLPPPNVTGNLHMGHALAFTIEDVIARWHRMLGYNVLWVPGLDHAGIATQVVVEREIYKQSQLTRHQLGREKFLDEVWNWKSLKENEIKKQLDALGLSLNWSREFFTLSPNLNKSVIEAFVRLYDRGLIYRDHRLVNWSCQLNSTISDIEVESQEINGATSISVPGYSKPVTVGLLHTFSYPLASPSKGCESIPVATTRLETMLGDTGIAVHPHDDRYSHLIGHRVRHPFITDRELPIVADVNVNPDLGTGAVKLTPAHSPIDLEMSRRHNLDLISVISDDGRICNTNEQFDGLPRFEARDCVQKALVDLGLYRTCSTDHQMILPLCSRSGDIVEYLIKDQWFVKCQEAANKVLKALDDDVIKIRPSHCKPILAEWLTEGTDWCISRQLWWGHRIPAYRIIKPIGIEDSSQWIIANSRSEAEAKAARILGVDISQISPNHLAQDEDVLDTWFSSSLLPFSIFGWPNENDDLSQFYPNQMLETGQDIIYFWVARMMMMGIELTGKLPFNEVYLHGLICDKNGKKMSKSKGNVVNPMSFINGVGQFDKKELGENVASFGADALRLALLNYNSTAQQISFNEMDVLSTSKFCNKIWQTARYVLMYKNGIIASANQNSELSPCFHWSLGKKTEWLNNNWSNLSHTNRWILVLMLQTVQHCDAFFKDRDFHLILKHLRSFWWASLCDIYLEFVKLRANQCEGDDLLGDAVTLMTVLDCTLRLLHPLMPHLSEVLWWNLCLPQSHQDQSLFLQSMPTPQSFGLPVSESETHVLIDEMTKLLSVIRVIKEFKLIIGGSQKSMSLLIDKNNLFIDTQVDLIKSLTRLSVNDTDFHSDQLISINLNYGISLLIDQRQSNHLTALENLQGRLFKQEERKRLIEEKLASTTSNVQELKLKTKMSDIEEQISTLRQKINLIQSHFSHHSSSEVNSFPN